MAVRQKSLEKVSAPGGDARIEEELVKRGIAFTFTGNVDPKLFDLERSRGNQARFEALDEKQVDNYAESMRRGEEFPPVVAYQRSGLYVVVDGNHRLHAAIQANKKLGVYDVSGAPGEAIQFLAIWFNTKHGKATSEAERIHHALYLIANGATIPDAAATVNLPTKTVQRASQSRAADQRFVDCNIPALVIEKTHESLKKRLSQISTDEGFVAAVDLTVRAKLAQAEVFKLVTELSELRSSSKQVAHVKLWEEDLQAKISGSAGGVYGKRVLTPKSRTTMVLGQIMALPDDLTSVAAAWAGPEREEAAQKARQAARRLNDLAKALSGGQ